MSGIFGVVQLDGAPVAPEQPAAMRSAMAHWGPDGVRGVTLGSAAFGHCHLLNTPEAVHERLPCVAADGAILFTAEARLDNRDELCEALEIGLPERPAVADGALILKAYERWGEQCPARLLGDWSFAVWRAAERRLFLARDHHGITSLYFMHDERRVIFASDRRALLALPGASRHVNEMWLARLLIAWQETDGTATVYRDLFRLPPAHTLSASPGHSPRLSRYWRLEDAPDIRLSSPAEYAEGLREQLDRAVASRLRSHRPIAIALSGGLDSGAVTVLAARHCAAANRRLLALTAVPLYECSSLAPARYGNEFDMAARTAAAAGNVDHLAVAATGISPLDGLDFMLDVHGEPTHAASQYYWIKALTAEARDRGVGVVLTAQHGNGTISWPGLPSWRSARAGLSTGRPRTVARELLSWMRARLPVRWPTDSRQEPWRDSSAIHPAFSARLRLRERSMAAGHDPTFRRRPRNGREGRGEIIRPGFDIYGARRAEVAAAFGVEARDPTRDVAVLTFTQGIPDHHFRGPLDRWLVRDAMRGLLPDPVRLSSVRGLQAADLVARVRASWPQTAARLETVARADGVADYLDVDYLRRVLAQSRTTGDQATHQAVSTVLLRGLGVGLFLARHGGPGDVMPRHD